ncbi:Clavaminate synthase-like protein [Aspergillus steynii IBT 23096]|uniref:Clavaminate synthase-like protein n=1 Tax=Aspergillus steynii IBT 23096 TaxID=1392250 RepID=A0A2I2GN82_9EURO|nr:Clavaminate synthase-like protein [Aspergillus steynii IBT 23096]PLB54342.1 Clavaminate synthase-like protein [Aspergillus steynii IBT 23096]
MRLPRASPRAQFSCLASNNPRLSGFRPLDCLDHVDVDKFRERCMLPEFPIVLPRGHFDAFPARQRWFRSSPSQLNTEYLQQHGADAFVPLELTQSLSEPSGQPGPPRSEEVGFRKFHAPLGLFLEWMRAAETQSPTTRLYLAQCQLLDLPQTLRDDFPAPPLVSQAGRGDIYDTNLWIGHPPTYTPLHRDPNPNLFVQLAGQKVVRLIAPDQGQAVFASVRRELGRSSDHGAAAFRGEEMMQGQERALLEAAVWGTSSGGCEGYEAHLEAGDGLFIPKGWWHSIKGVGQRVTASVNWWFR